MSVMSATVPSSICTAEDAHPRDLATAVTEDMHPVAPLSTVVRNGTLHALAAKALDHSGNQFFATMRKRMECFLNTISSGGEAVDGEAYEDASDTMTPENLLLVARLHAGELKKSKRKRVGVRTLYEDAMALRELHAVDTVFTLIILTVTLEMVLQECERRAKEAADKEEHWSAGLDDPVDWDERAEVVEEALHSWREARDAALAKQWAEFIEACEDLRELDVA